MDKIVWVLGSNHFIFRGGGGRKTSPKKISGSDFRLKTFSGPKGRHKKILRLDLGSALALRNLFSHSKIRLSQSKISFSHSVNCFTHFKSTLYLGNDFSIYKKEVFPPHRLMKRALGGFKKIIRLKSSCPPPIKIKWLFPYTPMERLSHREQHGIDVNVEIYFRWKRQLL